MDRFWNRTESLKLERDFRRLRFSFFRQELASSYGGRLLCVWACSSARLERTPDKREVGSSSLPRPTIYQRGQLGLRAGAIAQLGERLLCKQEVVGSIPSGSTNGLNALQRFAPF